jgi:hypothetical protein
MLRALLEEFISYNHQNRYLNKISHDGHIAVFNSIKITLTKLAYFSKICYHELYRDPIFFCANIVSISQVRASSLRLLLTVEYLRV